MKTFTELTDAERNEAVNQRITGALRLLEQGFPLFGDPKLMRKVKSAIAEAERMQTPWFSAEYIMDAVGEEIRANALGMAEGCIYAEQGDVWVVSGIAGAEREYHRGQSCPYRKGVICQEGYCDTCEIYAKKEEK